MDQPNDNQSQKKILEKIKSGQVTMHSRLNLVWRRTLWALGLCLLAVAGIFAVSFIIFMLKASGISDLPNLAGLHGLREFLAFFPWLFVPAVLLFLWLLERFVLSYSFAYRLPVLYSALAIIILIIFAGLAVSASSLHSSLYRNRSLPFAASLYRLGMVHPNDFYVGEVTVVQGKTYKILTREGRILNVSAGPKTNFFGPGAIGLNDFIEAIGEERGGEVQASAIRKLHEENEYPLRQHRFNLQP